MKLFIDDIRPAPEGWQCARTITAAIQFLAAFPVEEISLDYDCGTPNESFVAVAYYVCEKYWVEKKYTPKMASMRPLVSPKITIHTANPVGAKEMAALFEESGLRPMIKPILKT